MTARRPMTRRQTTRVIDAIKDAVASAFGIARVALERRERSPRLVIPRHAAIWIAHRLLPLSVSRIAEEFDLDRTSVTHALAQTEERMRHDDALAERIDALISRLEAGGDLDFGAEFEACRAADDLADATRTILRRQAMADPSAFIARVREVFQ